MLTNLKILLLFILSAPIHADIYSILELPTERTDGTPLQCELKTLKAWIIGDCAHYLVIDKDGRESDYSTQSCGGCAADLNHDGIVNAADLAIMKSMFFQTCPINGNQ